jgi:ubiquinone/menaquinone biosynthesis C-methylase UbiE
VPGNNQTVVEAFTEMAPNYEGTVDRELRQFWGVSYRDFIVRFLQPIQLQGHERVLDIGTGMAVVPTTLLRDTRWLGEVVGVDITPGMLAGARRSLEGAGVASRIRLVCGSGMVLPFHDHSFDAVTCALATHHMDVPLLLREMHRVLRPCGQLLVADVTLASFWQSRTGKLVLSSLAWWWYGRQKGGSRAAAEIDAITKMQTPKQWCRLLEESGLEDIRVTTVRARRRWYPPGILVDARTANSLGSR